MARKSKYTSERTKALYRKERSRIQSFLRNKDRQGFDTSDYILPSIPDRVKMEDVHKLERHTKDRIYQDIWWVNPDTGEWFKGKEAERERRKYTPSDGVIVVNRIMDALNGPISKRRRPEVVQIAIDAVDYIISLIANKISEYGKNEYGRMIASEEPSITEYIDTIKWDSDGEAVKMARVNAIKILNIVSLTQEQNARYTELREQSEHHDDENME